LTWSISNPSGISCIPGWTGYCVIPWFWRHPFGAGFFGGPVLFGIESGCIEINRGRPQMPASPRRIIELPEIVSWRERFPSGANEMKHICPALFA